MRSSLSGSDLSRKKELDKQKKLQKELEKEEKTKQELREKLEKESLEQQRKENERQELERKKKEKEREKERERLKKERERMEKERERLEKERDQERKRLEKNKQSESAPIRVGYEHARSRDSLNKGMTKSSRSSRSDDDHQVKIHIYVAHVCLFVCEVFSMCIYV